jgi:hypothetical protein
MLRIGLEEMEHFSEGLVATLQSNRIVCAITGWMACVEFGVAQGTKDCDLLCQVESAEALRRSLESTTLRGATCSYRSHLSAPLDARWVRGGWTAHFAWRIGGEEACLDVFGIAPRGSTPWESELRGLYASPHTVAEMKRTDRMKDWPFATSLGVQLFESGDPRGWLCIFDYNVLQTLAGRIPIPAEMIAHRPVLGLLGKAPMQLKQAIEGEIKFWQQLDHVRMLAYRQAVRPYVVAVKHDPQADAPNLRAQHECRVRHAEKLLAINPIQDYGLDRLIAEAQRQAAELVREDSLKWLPDVRQNFFGLGA